MENMEIFDYVNGLFEIGGGISVLLSIVKLYKDKDVKGINWITILFFTSWGVWNLIFYPKLDLPGSFAGAVFLVLMNAIWLFLLIYFQRDQRKKDRKKLAKKIVLESNEKENNA